MSFIIYTDGACLGNPGKGGWGYVILQDDKIVEELAGAEAYTTNNRMELKAAIVALESHSLVGDFKTPVEIFTDSQYVQKGITVWIAGWKAKGWFGSNKKPVKNKDLWLRLEKVKNKFEDIKFSWVRGHNGDKWNEYVDQLANSQAGIVV